MGKIIEINERVINEAKQALKNLEFSKLTLQLKAISALEHSGITKVSDVFGITRNTLKSWVRSFSKHGVSGLLPKPKKTRTPRLNSEQRQWLISTVQDYKKNWTLTQLKAEIARVWGVDLHEETVSRALKRMGFSYITPRPRHYKQNPEHAVEFKKKSRGNHRK